MEITGRRYVDGSRAQPPLAAEAISMPRVRRDGRARHSRPASARGFLGQLALFQPMSAAAPPVSVPDRNRSDALPVQCARSAIMSRARGHDPHHAQAACRKRLLTNPNFPDALRSPCRSAMSLYLAVEQNPIARQELIEPIEFADVARQHHLSLLDCLKVDRRIVQDACPRPEDGWSDDRA
jgi:hypothetical protein